MDGFFEGRVLGEVAHEPKVYTADDGKVTLYLSLLVLKTWGGEAHKQYVDVAVRGRVAEDYQDKITKGMTVMLSGDIQSKKREKGGVTYYTQFLSVFLDTLRVIGGEAPKQGGSDDDDVPW